MVILLTEQQHAALAHELNDRIVCVKHALAGEVFDFRREAAGVIDRAIDLESVTFPDDKVVMTMTRSRVNTSSSRFSVASLFLCFTDVELSLCIGFTAERNVLAEH